MMADSFWFRMFAAILVSAWAGDMTGGGRAMGAILITLDKNGGTGKTSHPDDPGGAAGFSISCEIGQSCALPEHVTTSQQIYKQPFTFEGWQTEPNEECSDGIHSGTFSKPTTLYACWHSCDYYCAGSVGVFCSPYSSANKCERKGYCLAGFFEFSNPDYPLPMICFPLPCDEDGYVRTDNGDCARLCDAGAVKLRAGDLHIPIYSSKQTSPAIHIKIGASVCYVSLAPGAASGALNINVGGSVYHSVR